VPVSVTLYVDPTVPAASAPAVVEIDGLTAIVSDCVAVAVLLLMEVAVIVAVNPVVTLLGALYVTDVELEFASDPHVAPLQFDPPRLQFTP
jgi:hypothetical protein